MEGPQAGDPITSSSPDPGDHGQADGGSVMQRYIDVCANNLDNYADIPSLSACASLDTVPPLCWQGAQDFHSNLKHHSDVYLRQWFSDEETTTLIISGPDGSGKSFVACNIVQGLPYWVRSPVISFHIPPMRPCETITARGVLASLCQQALLKFPNASKVEDLCDFLLDNPLATLSKDVFKSVLCSLAASLSSDSVLCVVTGIENLEDTHRNDLVEDLDVIVSHNDSSPRRFKLIITSDSGQTPSLTHPHQVIRLDSSREFSRVLKQSFLDRRLDMDSLRTWHGAANPIWELLEMPMKSFSDWLLNSSENMTDLARKVDFLEHGQSKPPESKEEAMKLVAKIQNPLTEHYTSLLQDLPLSGPGVNRLSVVWLLFSIRPLTVEEFGICGSLSQGEYKSDENKGWWSSSLQDQIPINRDYLAQELESSHLGRICRVVNDRVCLSQAPKHFDFLLQQLDSWQVIPREEVDLFLFNQCLSYLSAIFKEAYHSNSGLNDFITRIFTPPLSSRAQFVEYATLYWPQHLERACRQTGPGVDDAVNRAFSFLNDKEIFDMWRTLYGLFLRNNTGSSDPVEPRLCVVLSDNPLSSPMDAAIYFRLNRILDMVLESRRGRSDYEEVMNELRASLSSGNDHAIEKVLREHSSCFNSISAGTWKLITDAAVGCGYHAYLKVLEFSRWREGWDTNVLLQEAIRRGHARTSRMDRSLTCGVFDTPEPDPTKLRIAARIGDRKSLTELLERAYMRCGWSEEKLNKYVDTDDERGHTALMYAAEGGFHHVIELLCTGTFSNSLSGSSRQNYVLRVSLDRANKNGDTALHLAARQGAMKVISLLLSHKAKADIKNEQGETPLHIACQQGSVAVVNRILNGILSQHQQEETRGPVQLDGAGIVRTALQARDSAGNTPLHVAAAHGHGDIVQFLIQGIKTEYVVPIDLPNKLGKTALHLAVEGGHAKVTRWLLMAGAFARALDLEGTTPVDYAERGGYTEITSLLRISLPG